MIAGFQRGWHRFCSLPGKHRKLFGIEIMHRKFEAIDVSHAYSPGREPSVIDALLHLDPQSLGTGECLLLLLAGVTALGVICSMMANPAR